MGEDQLEPLNDSQRRKATAEADLAEAEAELRKAAVALEASAAGISQRAAAVQHERAEMICDQLMAHAAAMTLSITNVVTEAIGKCETVEQLDQVLASVTKAVKPPPFEFPSETVEYG